MPKPINSHISSKFHWVINKFLEENRLNIIKQDLDSGLVKITDNWIFFTSFYEIKRSDISIEKWKPFEADKNNYIALYKLSLLLGIPLFTLFFNKDKLKENWVKIFKVKSEKWNEMFEDLWIKDFKVLRNELLKLNSIDNDNIRENELQSFDENIYSLLNNFSNYNHIFYTENQNQWWMIISNSSTFLPLFIYKEIKFWMDEDKTYDNAFLDIANKLSLPIFKFSFNEDLNKIHFFEDIKTWERKNNLELNNFLEIYKSYIK